jgi:hypothetical protein
MSVNKVVEQNGKVQMRKLRMGGQTIIHGAGNTAVPEVQGY